MYSAATTEQIESYYEYQGFDVQITRDGYVEYRDPCSVNDGWRDGRWTSEYRIVDGNVALVG